MKTAQANECKYYPCESCGVNKDNWAEGCALSERKNQVKIKRIVFCFLQEAFAKEIAQELRDRFIVEAVKRIRQAEIKTSGMFCAEVAASKYIYLWTECVPLGYPGHVIPHAPCISSRKNGRSLRLGGFHPAVATYKADIVEKEVIKMAAANLGSNGGGSKVQKTKK